MSELHHAIFIKEDNFLRKVPIQTILWVHTEGNYSILHTTTKEYMLKISLRRMIEQLPQDHFVQIQRAYIVAIAKIEDIDMANNKVIIDGTALPIGRNYREELLSRLRILR